MWRSAGGEGRQEKAEACLDVGGRQPEVREDLALDRRIGDPDRARAELVAIVHGVVVERAAGERVAIELAHVLRMRRRERMVSKYRLPRLRIRLEQREVDHPTERVRDLRLRRQPPDHFLPHLVERGRRHSVGPDRHQRHVAIADADPSQGFRGEVPADGAGYLLPLTLDPREAWGTVGLRGFCKLVHVFARQRATTPHRDASHAGPVGRALEERHGEWLDLRGPVGDRKIEAQIGLVRPVAFHCFAPRQPRERPLDLLSGFVPQRDEHRLDETDYVLLPDERRLDVDL